ncbi:hypothetical protein NUW58_g9816 [Xylaria curta]|uniref:Uncharacterized protein n=1 Tax=Xylaria curta TaxID=42375 RepID=A0ACC1MSP4_9PEZI|nr:hypothetical protein NUW58_g9816 [Xylaria curta]
MSISQSSGPFSGAEARVKLGHQRLLLDIRELVTNPYPKITLYPNEDDIYHACLVFNPEHYHPLHLSISFPQEYPMHPPHVSMNSSVCHPHVFGTWICASVLGDDYTPAYTLKGLAIQLLSFFDSDSLEHEDLPQVDDLTYYQELNKMHLDDAYKCIKCGFGMTTIPREPRALPDSTSFDARVDRSPDEWPTIQSPITHSRSVHPHTSDSMTPSQGSTSSNSQTLPVNTKDSRIECNITRLPNEVLLLIIEQLDDFEHLTNFARAWSRISLSVRDFGVIRQRELQCFCLKTSYRSAKLGVGVTVNRGQISSEFDLLSKEAFSDLYVRYSIQGLLFNYWLPLPISRHHWNRVRTETHRSLSEIVPKLKALSSGTSDAHVLFTFMNDIVVRLNQVTEKSSDGDSTKSTLRHASEKAIESYFHLFHLLVCLATEDPSIVSQANKLLRDFENGKRSKTDCPNLGHLLVALLISDVQVTDVLIKSIITEAITRNVVWLLDRKGADMPELSYMERNTVSAYRLDKTFQGSRTSYRLLMFSELFRRTAR